jgi:hypothetical protein
MKLHGDVVKARLLRVVWWMASVAESERHASPCGSGPALRRGKVLRLCFSLDQYEEPEDHPRKGPREPG